MPIETPRQPLTSIVVFYLSVFTFGTHQLSSKQRRQNTRRYNSICLDPAERCIHCGAPTVALPRCSDRPRIARMKRRAISINASDRCTGGAGRGKPGPSVRTWPVCVYIDTENLGQTRCCTSVHSTVSAYCTHIGQTYASLMYGVHATQ